MYLDIFATCMCFASDIYNYCTSAYTSTPYNTKQAQRVQESVANDHIFALVYSYSLKKLTVCNMGVNIL